MTAAHAFYWNTLNPVFLLMRAADPRLDSTAARKLVFGTIAHESRFKYRRQLKGGPARSLAQVEPATLEWMSNGLLVNGPDAVKGLMLDLCEETPLLEQIERNDALAVFWCRWRYWLVTEALPKPHDTPGLGAYWKRYYNTPLGRGTTHQWLDDYYNFCAPITEG